LLIFALRIQGSTYFQLRVPSGCQILHGRILTLLALVPEGTPANSPGLALYLVGPNWPTDQQNIPTTTFR